MKLKYFYLALCFASTIHGACASDDMSPSSTGSGRSRSKSLSSGEYIVQLRENIRSLEEQMSLNLDFLNSNAALSSRHISIETVEQARQLKATTKFADVRDAIDGILGDLEQIQGTLNISQAELKQREQRQLQQ